MGITTTYVSDGQLPLTITSTDKTVTILYGLGPVAEQTTEWNYVLSDGMGAPRQLTDVDGEVTMFVRYNPWGKPIETSGTGNFDASFIGTLIDATTGLIYVGNGQYYDPETGRFLTRNFNPNSTNPYVPWNPIGVILGPLALVSANEARKKLRRMAGVAVGAGVLGAFLAACGKVITGIIIIILLIAGILLFCACNGTACGFNDQSEPDAATQTQPAEATTVEAPVTEEAGQFEQAATQAPVSPTPCVNCETPSPSYTPTPSPSLEQIYRITFTESGTSWESIDKDSAIRAVDAVAHKFAEILELSAADAWAATYEYMTFQMGGCGECTGDVAGYTIDRHNVQFAGLSNTGDKARNMVVHELGHAFKALLHDETGINAYEELTSWRDSHPGYPDRGKYNGGGTGPKVGFYSYQNQILWQVSLEGGDDEEFADQFLGWTFNKWEIDDVTGLLAVAGQARADMMEANMPNWVRLASH